MSDDFCKGKGCNGRDRDRQVLAVTMNDGEPVQNVPRSFKEEGQQVLKLIDNENGTYDLIVKKLEEQDREETSWQQE